MLVTAFMATGGDIQLSTLGKVFFPMRRSSIEHQAFIEVSDSDKFGQVQQFRKNSNLLAFNLKVLNLEMCIELDRAHIIKKVQICPKTGRRYSPLAIIYGQNSIILGVIDDVIAYKYLDGKYND